MWHKKQKRHGSIASSKMESMRTATLFYVNKRLSSAISEKKQAIYIKYSINYLHYTFLCTYFALIFNQFK